MWRGVSFQIIGEAAGICAAIAVIAGIVLQAGVFHRFQKSTPNTWRPEGGVRYALAVASRALVGVGFPVMFIYTGMGHSQYIEAEWLMIGLKFGASAWLALSLPLILSTANFVNVHRTFVMGLAIDWLIICLGCGVVCAKIIQY